MPRQNVLSPFPQSSHVHARCLKVAVGKAEQACRTRGARLTSLRRRVLELVWRSHEPVKAYDILDRLRAERRGAAPPTVYRALDFLREEGFVHKIESLNAYVGCGEPGHLGSGQFLICRHCGEVAEIDDGDIAALIADRARQLGFASERQTIEVDGLCGDCRAAR
ncbi:MAG: transcriptional repressor [Gammaproteobacteria bacterium]|nr:transcriptional repressor [Gammaproteobacteria bacterium]